MWGHVIKISAIANGSWHFSNVGSSYVASKKKLCVEMCVPNSKTAWYSLYIKHSWSYRTSSIRPVWTSKTSVGSPASGAPLASATHLPCEVWVGQLNLPYSSGLILRFGYGCNSVLCALNSGRPLQQQCKIKEYTFVFRSPVPMH